MTRDFRSEAEQEVRRSEAFRQWVSMRVEAIHDKVSPEDVLGRYGVSLRHGGARAEQFSCPFHGKDNKPSTRFYPAEGRKPSGVWCFVCQERWDAIALFRKFEQLEGPFTRVLASIEKAFGLPTPEVPREAIDSNREDPLETEVRLLTEVCERRLRGAKPRFSLESYLRVGSVLDRLDFQLRQGKRTGAEALGVLRKLLEKVGERERSG